MKEASKCFGIGAGLLLVLAGMGMSKSAARRVEPGSVAGAHAVGGGPRTVESYGKLPLSFEVNRGQADAQVRFLARGQGYGLFLTSEEAVLSLHRSEGRGPRGEERTAKTPNAVLKMRMVGANGKARVSGEEELPGKSNYFIGNDPKKWRTNIPAYAKVRVENVYPGVDLVYYGNQGQLEYDFVVNPGADLSTIKLALAVSSSAEGGQRGHNSGVKIDENGDLAVQVDGGEVRFHKPVVYQRGSLGGAQKTTDRISVDGRYAISGQNEVAFTIGEYDKTKPLVIDPVLVYSTYLGGYQGVGIAVDSSGSAYVTGWVGSPGFPTTANAFQSTYQGNLSSFVTKFSADGAALIYSTYLGGSDGLNYADAISVDGSGSAYITGSTSASDFPTANAFQATNPSFHSLSNYYANALVTKLNADGSALVYSTYLGGSQRDQGRAIAVDSSGFAYVTGTATSSNFPTANPFQSTLLSPQGDAFVTKFNPQGSTVVYSTYLGGHSQDFNGDIGYGIAADSSGNAYVTGITGSTDFPTTSGALQPQLAANSNDAFVTKFNPDGSALVYSTYLGGSGYSSGNAIAVDSSGNAYVTGQTMSTNFPTVNPFQPTLLGRHGNAFVAKLNSSGTALVYSSYLGGNGNSNSFWGDSGNGIAVDSAGNAHVTGYTSSPDFPTANAIQGTNHGGPNGYTNAFVTEFTPDGSTLAYSTYLGGSDSTQFNFGDWAYGIAVDGVGNAYITGITVSNDFPTTSGAFQPNSSNASYTGEVFVTKIYDAADTTINSAAPTVAASGTLISYTIVVTNHGPDTAFNVNIADVIPAGTTFNSVSVSAGSCTAPVPGDTGTVTCTAPSLANNGVITEVLTVNVTAAMGSAVMDTATVSSSTYDPFPGNNSAEITTTVI